MESLNSWGLRAISRDRTRYYEHLLAKHRYLDMKGLRFRSSYSMKLSEGFVEVYLVRKPPHKVSTNPMQTFSKQSEGEQERLIWEYLTTKSLHDQHLAITGSSGRGKTTLLKHIIVNLVKPESKYRHYLSALLHKVPIFLSLKFIAENIEEHKEYTLIHALRSDLEQLPPRSPVSWVEQQLHKGRCLIMLDGLDEIADPQLRHQTVEWLEKQMDKYSKNRFIITSRPFGSRDGPPEKVHVLEIASFKYKQIKSLVDKWYIADEYQADQNKPQEAIDLLRRLRNTPALFDLAVNPLLLTMIVLIHMNLGTLPGSRLELYGEICEVFFGRRREVQGQKLELRPEQVKAVLQPLAYYMMSEGILAVSSPIAQMKIEPYLKTFSLEMSPIRFLELVENMSGLFLKQEDGNYKFAHMTFQEYLASSHIFKEKLESVLVQKIKHRENEAWWDETIRLYCAQAEGTLIVNACLNCDPPSESALTLAFDCLEMQGPLEPTTRTRLENLRQGIVERTNIRFQRAVVGARLLQRSRQMICLDDEIYIDVSLITHIEYQIFLDELRAKGIYCQPDHWHRDTFEYGSEQSPVLGLRLSDAKEFCKWLTSRHQGQWDYRLPEIGEIENISKIDISNTGTKKTSKLSTNRFRISKIPANVGYWINGGQDFEWAGVAPPLPKNFVRDQYILDFTADDLINHIEAHAYALHPTCHLNLDRIIASFRALKDGSQLLKTFEHHSDRGFALARNINDISELTDARKHILSRLHSFALYFVSEESRNTISRYSQLLHFNSLKQKRYASNEGDLINAYIDMYVSLAILEARIDGRLYPCEGILLVKERRKDSEQ